MKLAALGAFGATLLLSLTAGAADRDPDATREAALLAFEARSAYCPSVAGGNVAVAAESTVAAVEAWARVSETFESGGAPHLQYWRGVLAQCLGRPDDAIDDLIEFVVAADLNPELSDLSRDAMRRLRMLGVPVASTLRERGIQVGPFAKAEAEGSRERRLGRGGAFERGQPLLIAGLGSGWQRVGPYDYAGLDLDVSVRLGGMLRGVVGGATALSGPTTAGGEAVVPAQRSSLTTLAIGAELRIPWPVRATVSGRFLLAGNPYGSQGPPVLVGGAIRGGGDVPIPKTPMHVGAFLELGGLDRFVAVRIMGRVAVAI